VVERALAASGVPFAIVRPTVVFGREDILLNNIAWLLRRFPVFAVAGKGDYELRPVHVDDLAALCAELGPRHDDVVVDAVGPETYSFVDLVKLLRHAVGSRTPIVHAPTGIVSAMARILSVGVRDVLLTRDELDGMMAGLVTVDGPATCPTSLREWVMKHRDALGAQYASELARHYVTRAGEGDGRPTGAPAPAVG
jgi:NADH dehydrogenase